MASVQTTLNQEIPVEPDADSNSSQEGSDDGKKLTTKGEDSRGEASIGREDSQHGKDFAKKKKSSATAKLKQSKRDIRREQFLAQVAAKSTGGQALPHGKREGSSRSAEGYLLSQEQANGHGSCDSTEGSSCQVSSVGTDDEEEAAVQLALSSGELDATSQGSASGINGSRSTLEESSGTDHQSHGEQDRESASSSHGKPAGAGSRDRMDAGGSSSLCKGAKAKGENDFLGKERIRKGKGVLFVNGVGEGKTQSVKGGKKGARNGMHLSGRASESDLHALALKAELGGPGDSGDGATLEDDWEAAAEEFSKQVAKVVGRKGESQDDRSSDPRASGTPETSSEATGESTSGETRVKPSPVPAAEYSFRPNQQEAGSRQPPDGCLSARVCAPASLRPEYSYSSTSSFSRSRSANDRAWRPDDVARPQTLPPALSQRPASRGLLGVPGDLGLGNSWRAPHQLSPAQWPAPSSAQPACCPICAEELDVTDSSFVPCQCGFRLCLFCHHRIAADDGRCPGCRRAYSPDVASRLSKPPTSWLRL